MFLFLNSMKGGAERKTVDESEEGSPDSEEVEQIDLQGDREESEREAEGEQAGNEEENDQEAAAPLSDLGDKDTGPRQVKLNSYPQDSFGAQKRAFNHSWFAKYHWLEYSVSRNAVFCFPCRVFGKNIKHDALVSSGCRHWKKALAVFRKHDLAQSHKDSVVAWRGYQATTQQGDVVQMMMSAEANEIAARREYLKRIIAVTSMLGAQGLPFRGDDESVESTNRGNFLACMGLLRKFDPFLQNHIPPSNSTYISPVSQNEMIECCAQEVTNVIVSEITRSKMYAIMADEARDGQSEQLAVCVRYVSEGEVKEHFLALAELMSFDAQSIADKLQEQLQTNGIADVKCVAQTYDGAAVMSGPTGVVQTLLSITEGLHKLLQKETLDLAEALIGKDAVCDTLKDGTVTATTPQDVLAVHNLFSADMFPSLKEVLQVALTVPVSSCSCERSFSALRRLHTWLRKTMGQKRLHNLAVMAIENGIVSQVNDGKIIDRFATKRQRRHSLIIPPTK
ncbi:uncharacterized protein LOC142401375 [Odontesthes bonariensis]|uniref:uncharacterized protein LOC142401375 n=1 Tax=Odontesthes bonariensis TaxID=219752 RepID=UPI003F58312C